MASVVDRAHCFTTTSHSLTFLFRKARASLKIEDSHFDDSRAEALTRFSRKVGVMTLVRIGGQKDLSILPEDYYREASEQIAARV
ncbi:hypothetical protein P3T43_004689 [Paraburkholderia sp. GAS41]|uniref:hypothetical protein n=1 Tax=Paraburkholderia sp. GAS41 TaxID=3035134 RepID=UPI003D25CF97